jgi:hypothetical protein
VGMGMGAGQGLGLERDRIVPHAVHEPSNALSVCVHRQRYAALAYAALAVDWSLRRQLTDRGP